MGSEVCFTLELNKSNISITRFSKVCQSLQGPHHIDDLNGLIPIVVLALFNASVLTADIIYD